MPVFHKLIQLIIQQEIQPIIIKQIQPIIHREIQPVVFTEDQNIEEEIQKLIQSKIKVCTNTIIFDKPNYHKKGVNEKVQNSFDMLSKPNNIINDQNPKYKETPKSDMHQPTKKTENLGFEIQPYIIEETKIVKQPIIQPIYHTMVRHIKQPIIEPLIKYRNGNILTYKKRFIEVNSEVGDRKKEVNFDSEIMDTIIAIIFFSAKYNINFPMACKKTDIFAKIEEKLYYEFPLLKSKKLYFIVNGNIANRSLTFEQNNIKSGSTILINEIE